MSEWALFLHATEQSCKGKTMEDQTRETPETERPEIGSEDHAKRVAQQNDQFRRWHCIGERKPGVFVEL